MTYLLACAGAYIATLLTAWMSVRVTGRAHLGLALGMFAINLAGITAATLAIAGAPTFFAESGAVLARVSDLARSYVNGVVAFCLPLVAQLVLGLPFILILRGSAWPDDETGTREDGYPDDPVMTRSSGAGGAEGPSVAAPRVEPGSPAPGQRVEPTVY